MTFWGMLWIIILVLAFIVALCAVAVWMEKHYPGEAYDERQKQAKGRGYRLSYWTGLGYFLCIAFYFLFQAEKETVIEPYLLVAWGLLLQVMVDHTYCVITHSALPLSQKPGMTIVSYLMCGSLQLVNFYQFYMRYGAVSFVGADSAKWIFLTAGICFYYLVVLHAIQLLRDREE